MKTLAGEMVTLIHAMSSGARVQRAQCRDEVGRNGKKGRGGDGTGRQKGVWSCKLEEIRQEEKEEASVSVFIGTGERVSG